MSKKLDVYLHENCVGTLEQNQYGELLFQYKESWLENSVAYAISCSLPLRKEVFKEKECRPFFAGVLPEDTQRKLVAKNLGISANNDFKMLEKIGGECAGAITFISTGELLDEQTIEYDTLTEQKLAELLLKIDRQPLLAGERGVRLSMAGVQDKIPVHVVENQVSVPKGRAPSTHIIKSDNIHFPGLIYNEAYCLNLSRKVGLSTAQSEIKTVCDKEYLLIKRYDRVISDGAIARLHQEDFCQALGFIPERKYQNEGGPSLSDCFGLIRQFANVPAIGLEKLIEAVIFNVVIGNCDVHGKNYSLLYRDGIEMAPLYDLVCTIYYPELTNKMAMKIGKTYDIRQVDIDQFYLLAEKMGFSKAGTKKRFEILIEKIYGAVEEDRLSDPVSEEVGKIVKKRCRLLTI